MSIVFTQCCNLSANQAFKCLSWSAVRRKGNQLGQLQVPVQYRCAVTAVCMKFAMKLAWISLWTVKRLGPRLTRIMLCKTATLSSLDAVRMREIHESSAHLSNYPVWQWKTWKIFSESERIFSWTLTNFRHNFYNYCDSDLPVLFKRLVRLSHAKTFDTSNSEVRCSES